MTDIVSSTAVRLPRVDSRVTILWTCVVVAAFAGAWVGTRHAADPATVETTLTLLLRFMAVCKASAALAATLLVAWRLRRPLPTTIAVAYTAGVMAMAVAPGLIWGLGLVAPGALSFHAGFVSFLVLAACDDAVGASLSRTGRRAR